MNIRRAVMDDVKDITDIYNYAVVNNTATMETRVNSISYRREWLGNHVGKYVVLVIEEEGTGRVLGWASLSPFSDREGYCYTAEFSIYLHPHTQGKGYGKKLMKAILDHAYEDGRIHSIIAKIIGANNKSIAIHYQFGFHHVGTLKEAGYKLNQTLDSHIFQLLLTEYKKDE